MTKFLLDTNICIYFLKGLFDLDKKLKAIGLTNCYISEITVAELRFGVEKSQKPQENGLVCSKFINGISVLPIYSSIDVYAKEKASLQKVGTPVDDFDLLIGATAIHNKLTLVTNNTKHFKRLKGIQLEDWTQN